MADARRDPFPPHPPLLGPPTPPEPRKPAAPAPARSHHPSRRARAVALVSSVVATGAIGGAMALADRHQGSVNAAPATTLPSPTNAGAPAATTPTTTVAYADGVWTGASEFTRFGDVLTLLKNPDDMYVVMGPGDEATLQFDASSAKALPTGWKRDFLLYTDGWIKDSDLNTAFGTTVGPLPYHNVKSYPYASGDAYPTDSRHAEYLRKYSTRIVKGNGGAGQR